MAIKFFIPHRVRPKQSFRKGRFGRNIPDEQVVENARSLSQFAAQYRPAKPLSGPLRVEYLFQYPWRKSESMKNRLAAGYGMPKDTMPDADNLAKQMNDVLEATGFFANDSSIADMRVRKVWTDSPGVYVFLEEMT